MKPILLIAGCGLSVLLTACGEPDATAPKATGGTSQVLQPSGKSSGGLTQQPVGATSSMAAEGVQAVQAAGDAVQKATQAVAGSVAEAANASAQAAAQARTAADEAMRDAAERAEDAEKAAAQAAQR